MGNQPTLGTQRIKMLPQQGQVLLWHQLLALLYTDMNAEFVLNAIELLQAISLGVILADPASNKKDPLPTLLQIAVEETVNVDISAVSRAIPATTAVIPVHDLTVTKEELETLAQAMVIPGPPQRFAVRGVDRRKNTEAAPRFKCLWERSQCSASPFEAPGELYDHLLQHLKSSENPEPPCLWATCPLPSTSKQRLRPHLLTHLSSSQPPAKHPSQDDTITITANGESYPFTDPTKRQPPPLRQTNISYTRPVADPPSAALTALVIIREHFEFPGAVEDDEGDDVVEDIGGELEGERRGRRAFVGVKMMEDVRMKDEALMRWMVEMVYAACDGPGLFRS
ncbi:uncharacterized protein F5891DRAFT_1256403 [Suillus fuscotomentosus]|uniref:Uncharacterized protein n=1 Tax=Suillus fuscotomentosus TaxID=1912939 RepID=A0AAD4DWH9_9AGAM|nr:uncharacterized protein F5891DRAFT_1256403 [Suillus fuscotomentosus]KAG1894169.1 hypothetical protein F5891DRAFT_1256403 [Suillus fuscotomentosus]